jgi:hypothetical protein
MTCRKVSTPVKGMFVTASLTPLEDTKVLLA